MKYTDPTGHAQASDVYTESDGECDPGDTSCNWVGTGGNNNGNAEEGADNEANDGEGGGLVIPSIPPGTLCSGCPLASSYPPGPACTSTNNCYIPSYLLEPHPWIPDYLAIEVGVPVAWIFGADFVLTVDKYNRIYFGGGPSGGTSPVLGLDVNASISVGYIRDDNTTAGEAHSFITKWSGGGCVGAAVGYCRVTGDPFDGHHTWANQYGFFTPQAGAALPYSWQILPLPK